MLPRIIDFRPAIVLVGLVAALNLACGARSIPQPQPGHPGNVFLAGEEVVVSIPPGDRQGWRLFDYEGQEIGIPTARDAKWVLGQLPVGFYRLQKAGETNANWISVGVIERLRAPTPTTSPVALDVAMAWFYGDDQMPQAANLCAMAGVNWVRDRLSWREVEPKRGEFVAGTRYDHSAEAQFEAGLRLLQVNHSSPAWANPVNKRFPLDLRDAFRFHQEIARRWRGQVEAFEPWNEADIDVFGGHTGAEMAAMQKAACLGLKAGNPDAVACLNVFAHHRKTQLEDLAANQAWPYFDTYNLHHYEAFERYPQLYADHRAVSAGRPLWVSECALPVKWSGDERSKELSDDHLRLQSERLVKVFALSLHEGSAATFYFLLPHYTEQQTQFGILRPDLTPRPAFVALAAVGRWLADARPLGRVRTASGAHAFAFAAKPEGAERTVLVGWADERNRSLDLPVQPSAIFDHLGRKRPAEARKVLALMPAPCFAVLAKDPGLDLEPPPSRPAWLAGERSPVVLQPVMPEARIVLAHSAYQIPSEREERIGVHAYNFGTAPLTGTLRLSLSEGLAGRWADPGDASIREIRLLPMERLELAVLVQCGRKGVRLVEKVNVIGDFGPDNKPVLSFKVMPDPPVTPTEAIRRLPGADAPERWKKEISGNGRLQLTALDKGWELVAEPGGADRWLYPRLDLNAAERAPAGAAGLSFTLTLLEGRGTFRAIWVEENGGHYVSEFVAQPKAGQTLEATVLFDGAVLGHGWSPPDPNGKLDPERIVAIKIGVNTTENRVKFQLKNLRWISD